MEPSNPRIGLVCGPSLRPAWHLDRLRAEASRHFPDIRVARPGRGALAATLREAGERLDLLLLAGGDGLCQLAVTVCRPWLDRLELGILPAGTGNDFARSLGIPSDPERAISGLPGGRRRRVDLLRARFADGEERLCVNAVLGGALAASDPGVGWKRRLGRPAYVLDGLRALRGGVRELRWTEDGTVRRSMGHVIALHNGRTVGGGVPLAPEARLDDGLMDVVTLRVTPGNFLSLGTAVLRGRHTRRDDVHAARCARVEVDDSPGIVWNLDGEVERRAVRVVEVLTGALRVRVPRGVVASGR